MSYISGRTKQKKNFLLRQQYNSINDLVLNQHYSIDDACKYIKVHRNRYHYICKRLGVESIAKKRKKVNVKIIGKDNEDIEIDSFDSLLESNKNKKLNIIPISEKSDLIETSSPSERIPKSKPVSKKKKYKRKVDPYQNKDIMNMLNRIK